MSKLKVGCIWESTGIVTRGFFYICPKCRLLLNIGNYQRIVGITRIDLWKFQGPIISVFIRLASKDGGHLVDWILEPWTKASLNSRPFTYVTRLIIVNLVFHICTPNDSFDLYKLRECDVKCILHSHSLNKMKFVNYLLKKKNLPYCFCSICCHFIFHIQSVFILLITWE